MKLTALTLLLWLLPVPASAQRVALIVVDFTHSATPNDMTMAWQRTEADRVQAFYAEQSYGRFSLPIDTFGVFRVPLDESARYEDISREAQAAAIAAGMDPLRYTTFVYVSPLTDTVRAGIARGREVFIALTSREVAAARWDMIAHELGHAVFSYYDHAHGYRCDGGGLSGDCTFSSYGDAADVMGYGYGHFNNIRKLELGWLDPEQIPKVTRSGDYVITPLRTGGGVKGIRIDAGHKRSWEFVLEYRPSDFAFQPFIGNRNGALVRMTLNGSQLLYMNPLEDGIVRYPALGLGQTWCDREARVSVTSILATPDALTVRVKFGNCR